MSFNAALGFGVVPVAGYYRERATAPDGTVYEDTLTPLDGAVTRFLGHGHNRPGGEWRLEHYALGLGAAGIEGVAYEIYDIELPTGRVTRGAGPTH